MTLQRRLIIAVLLAAPLAWMLTIFGTYWRAEHEINELYDTDMVRMAQQVRALLPALGNNEGAMAPRRREPLPDDHGHAGLNIFAVSVWRNGEQVDVDGQGEKIPKNGDTEGFKNGEMDGVPWRFYYLNQAGGGRVAVGQRLNERDELALTYVIGQIVPWLIALPILIGLLIAAVRRAIRPLRDLSAKLERRNPDDSTPLHAERVPGELIPLINSMNGLLRRVATAIEQERRLTADAAHELRTPLAAMKAHWDIANQSSNASDKVQAIHDVGRGIERMDRMVSQLLVMARLENSPRSSFTDLINWHSVVEQALGDCLWLARRRNVDIDVIWPSAESTPLPIVGDADSLSMMLRNLIDNAVRYSPQNSIVTVTFTTDSIHIDDSGPGVPPEMLSRLGDRFFRLAGQLQSGSGLGISIARHVARLHGLSLRFEKKLSSAEPPVGLRVNITRRSEVVDQATSSV